MNIKRSYKTNRIINMQIIYALSILCFHIRSPDKKNSSGSDNEEEPVKDSKSDKTEEAATAEGTYCI